MDDASAVDENKITGPQPTQGRRPRRVAFVIDDSEDVHELFGEALESAGYRVVPAHNGRQALDLLLDLPVPTVIVLDLIMPGINGFELLDVISSYSRFATVPVLVVTASCDEIKLDVPFGKCLKKPVDGALLVESVDALVDLKQSGT